MEDVKKEFLLELYRVKVKKEEAPSIDEQVRNVVRFLLAFGFELGNVVHLVYDDEQRVILVDDQNDLLPSFGEVFDLYSSVYVVNTEDINESDIDEVYGEAKDFLSVPTQITLTEAEKEERIRKILSEIDYICFEKKDPNYDEVMEKTILSKDEAIKNFEKTAGMYYQCFTSGKTPDGATLDDKEKEHYKKLYYENVDANVRLKKGGVKFVVAVKTMEFFNDEWSFYLEKELKGNTLCEAFQEFLDMYLQKADEYELYKNYNLKYED